MSKRLKIGVAVFVTAVVVKKVSEDGIYWTVSCQIRSPVRLMNYKQGKHPESERLQLVSLQIVH